MRRNSDRRWQLRHATAKAHASLDAAVGGFTDRASYARYLTALYTFRAAVEDESSTRIAPLLARDLSDLDLPVPATVPPPPVKGSAHLGRLYVLEGAALGGQILRKRAAAIGFDDTKGARHLALTPAGWLDFLARLDAADDYDPDAAARAANDAFALALQAFTKACE